MPKEFNGIMYCSVKEVSEKLGVTEYGIRSYIKKGKFGSKVIRLAKLLLIEEVALQEFMENLKVSINEQNK